MSKSGWVSRGAQLAVPAVVGALLTLFSMEITTSGNLAPGMVSSGIGWILVLVMAWALFAAGILCWVQRVLRSEVKRYLQAMGYPPPMQSQNAESHGGSLDSARARWGGQAPGESRREATQEQNTNIESLQFELNTDAVTGLANRKYFLNELRRVLHHAANSAHNGEVAGYVLIFRQRDLAAINAFLSRDNTDAWLRRLASALQRQVLQLAHPSPDAAGVQLARLNGSDFALLIPGADVQTAVQTAARGEEAVRKVLASAPVSIGSGRYARWRFAMTEFGHSCTVSGVLSRLDHGLTLADTAGQDTVEYVSRGADTDLAGAGAAGQDAWRRAIQHGLDHRGLELMTRPAVYRFEEDMPHIEASLGLRDDANGGRLVSGYLFMPAAARLGLSAACDVRAVELGLDWLHRHDGCLILRVSLPSLLEADFHVAVRDRLEAASRDRPDLSRLVFELDAYGLTTQLSEMQAFCAMVIAAGARIGLRRLADQPGALLHLHEIPLSYIKLSGPLTTGLRCNPGALRLVEAITAAAIGMGLKVYASEVGDDDSAALLREYGVLLPLPVDDTRNTY